MHYGSANYMRHNMSGRDLLWEWIAAAILTAPLVGIVSIIIALTN